jgi:tetratricopeptide (TPR) repeat protein
LSQHELAGAYQANGQVKEAVKLLERVVVIQAGVLAEDHPSRLASQHELAGAYQANGQIKEAIKLLEHVVIIKRKIMVEDHPSRLVSEELLISFYYNVPWRSETRQTSKPSIENVVAKDEDGREFNQALEVPQAISSNSSALIARSHQSSADKELKSSSTSKRRHLLRRLRGMLRKE